MLLVFAARRKNALFVRERPPAAAAEDEAADGGGKADEGGNAEAKTAARAGEMRIDVWWRGRNQNGPFMLAIARLMQQQMPGRPVKIRMCQLAEEGADPGEAKKLLAGFLSDARVEAEPFVKAFSPTITPIEQIAKASSGADFSRWRMAFSLHLNMASLPASASE